jgi:dipicolinate synthase subunit A
MAKYIFFPANQGAVLRAAGETLKSKGYGVVDHPCASVTHLLLPVPGFQPGCDLQNLLKQLPGGITIVGGNLNPDDFPGYKLMDLLQDPTYLARNAAITAYCALRLAMMELPVMLRGCQVLVIGWGRIGKCLSALLWALEAEVTVVARKEEDRAMAHALGYHAEAPENLGRELNRFQLIYNTAPATVLTEEQMSNCRDSCLKIDLASVRGIQDSHMIWARGLPGKDTPGSSGKLIAKTVIRLLDRKESL